MFGAQFAKIAVGSNHLTKHMKLHANSRRLVGTFAIAAQLSVLASCERAPSPPSDPSASTRPSVVAPVPDFRGMPAGDDVRALVDWAVEGDAGDRAFAVVDKRNAHIYVFSPQGRLLGSSWVLIGLAPGDNSEPGIGDKKIADITPDERTTPAGRFVTMPGRNAHGRPVVWIDYDAAISMHSVVTDVPSEQRLQRLAATDPAEHRISYGCINLPPEFFAAVALPAFAQRGGIVYILPDTRPLPEVFPALRNVALATTTRPTALLAAAEH